jgi:D-sedoheptulose 7-phosphate isomerase
VSVTRTAAIDELVARRTGANERFFGAEAARIARLCRRMAESFERGGRLLAVGGSPQDWSDAHHIAVEFVHPVIVGKRALPALAIDPRDIDWLARTEDLVVSFSPLTIAGEVFEPPTDDPFVRQELGETLYHVLWELVHVYFDHLGGSTAGAGASGFLYPFLDSEARDLTEVEDDVRASVLMKAHEVAELRLRTVEVARDELFAAAVALRETLDGGGTLFAFGNGGSATDAMDLVADFRAAPQGWAPRRAIDLTADSAILTALANDIGPDVMFARQLIAYGKSDDAVIALSTSGDSANVIEALAEATRRGLRTIAFVGYDGGRIAADRLADHVVVTPSEHIPRIQEAQATAYHSLRELVESVS